MRVTDEMVRAACHAYAAVGPFGPPYLSSMRAALEAALADVPEPAPLDDDMVHCMRVAMGRVTSILETRDGARELLARAAEASARVMDTNAKLRAAEAKLEKARAWMDSGESRYLLRGDLRIILDEDP